MFLKQEKPAVGICFQEIGGNPRKGLVNTSGTQAIQAKNIGVQ
jgi:hypothetical protein